MEQAGGGLAAAHLAHPRPECCCQMSQRGQVSTTPLLPLTPYIRLRQVICDLTASAGGGGEGAYIQSGSVTLGHVCAIASHYLPAPSGFMRLRNITGKSRILRKPKAAKSGYGCNIHTRNIGRLMSISMPAHPTMSISMPAHPTTVKGGSRSC